MSKPTIDLYIGKRNRIVPNNAYWKDKVNNPEYTSVNFLNKKTSKIEYSKEYLGYRIYNDIIVIKVGRFTHKNGVRYPRSGDKIECINNGIVYPSVSEAARKLGIHQTYISRAINGYFDKCKGLKFKRA